jgi:hypothetical protein
MRNVIQVFSGQSSPVLWRNLAEQPFSAVESSAGAPGHLVRRHLSAVRVFPGELIALGRAADVPGHGAEEQGQAGDQRVGDKGHPDRNRQGDRRAQEDHTDEGREKHVSSDHFSQPPREECPKDARVAWQQCGCVLVKVRLAGRKTRKKRGMMLGWGGGSATFSDRPTGCRVGGRTGGPLVRVW